MLYRLFPYDPAAQPTEEGGSLFVPRALQGPGRHDNPGRYGALYTSRTAVSVVAEHIRRFVHRPLQDAFLHWERGLPYAVAALDDDAVPGLIDLDDPRVLVDRDLRPSDVATLNRKPTRRMAAAIYEEGAPGFEWWSTIEASWINVTLFSERVLGTLRVMREPQVLTLDHPAVVAAADAVGVMLPA